MPTITPADAARAERLLPPSHVARLSSGDVELGPTLKKIVAEEFAADREFRELLERSLARRTRQRDGLRKAAKDVLKRFETLWDYESQNQSKDNAAWARRTDRAIRELKRAIRFARPKRPATGGTRG